MTAWGSPVEREVRRRILVSVAAYGYEFHNVSIMIDAHWDQTAQEINPRMGTCHPVIDEFFATKFSPMTGMWIHEHPELERIKTLFENYYRDNRSWCDRATKINQQ